MEEEDLWLEGKVLKDWTVNRVSRQEITGFIEMWHYSHSINGCMTDYCYALFDGEEMLGAMFFGRMAMANQWRRFGGSADDVIELRRLCCTDGAPKNTESFFIGKALKLLSREWGGRVVVSYADREHGHSGTIYRASNFKEEKPIPGAKVIVWGDRQYHDKAIRTKYKGELKPFAKRIREALEDGRAYYRKTAGKHTFVYHLDRGKRHGKRKQ